MATDDYFTPYQTFSSRCDDYDENYSLMLEEVAASELAVAFSSAKRYLAVGPGSGLSEIRFIKRLMPNLEVLTAVEVDRQSAAELRSNLQQHLPHVACTVHEMPCHKVAENGFGDGQPYDLVTIFHVLYHVSAEHRRMLYGAIYGHLLSPTGYVLIGHASQCHLPDSRMQIVRHLAAIESAAITDTDIQAEMEKTGFRIVASNEICFRCDMSTINQDLIDFFSIWAGRSVSQVELDETVRKVWPSGVTEKNYVICMWFQK